MAKLGFMLIKQAYHTMAIVGAMVSAVYVMRALGFHDPLPWNYAYYPFYVVGLFVGYVLKEIYRK